MLRDYGYLNGVWALPLEEGSLWEAPDIAGAPPAGRYAHSCVYDPLRRRAIVFGGSDDIAHFNDTWALSLTRPETWTRILPEGQPPPARHGHSAIYDLDGDRMIIFGGQNGPGFVDFMNDVWSLSLGDEPRWARLEPSGPAPSTRSEHTAIYDPIRKRMIVYSGASGGTNPDDVWALTLDGPPAWTRLAVSGALPGGFWGHTATYDALRDRMVVQYGRSAYALSLGEPMTWTRLEPLDEMPPPLWNHTAMYDPVGDRVIFFLGSVWELAWGHPARRVAIDFKPGGAGAMRGPVPHGASRLAILGSARFDAGTVDVASLCAPGMAPWNVVGHPAPPLRATDMNRDGYDDAVTMVRTADLNLVPTDTVVVVEGENLARERFRGTGRLRFAGGRARPVAGDETTAGEATAVGDSAPSGGPIVKRCCSDRELEVWLPGTEPAVLEVFDLAGRRCLVHRFEGPGPGRQIVGMKQAAAIRAGVYFVRMRQGPKQSLGRIVILE